MDNARQNSATLSCWEVKTDKPIQEAEDKGAKLRNLKGLILRNDPRNMGSVSSVKTKDRAFKLDDCKTAGKSKLTQSDPILLIVIQRH